MKIYLMRHGETDYNRRRCFYGSRDVSINETGKKQALRIADLLKQLKVDCVYTSQLKRTQETARLIFSEARLHPMSSFNERDFGLWEGLTANEIQEAFPDSWTAWLEAPFDVTPPQAESFSNFKNRVWQGIDELLVKDKSSTIAIVAHLGVLRLIYHKLIDKEAVFWDIDFPQGTVTCFEFLDKKWMSYLLGEKEVENANNT